LDGCDEKLAEFLRKNGGSKEQGKENVPKKVKKSSPTASSTTTKRKQARESAAPKKPKTSSSATSKHKETESRSTRLANRPSNILAFEKLLKKDPGPAIRVFNEYNSDGPPEGFKYINDYVGAPPAATDFLVGCSCAKEKGPKSCFGKKCECDKNYDEHGIIQFEPKAQAIYECNAKCECPSSCPNRVVQRGRQVKLDIFRAPNSKGWAVRAGQFIPKGMFIAEYLGEIISVKEAAEREKQYGGISYLFDLDFDTDNDCLYTIDAFQKGNISHFINHSCDPNLAAYTLFINNHDTRLHRVALFTTKDVNKGTELCFDYGGRTEDDDGHLNSDNNAVKEGAIKMECLCGSVNCRKFLWL
jgi:histone-lysine N-methyltransferase SUV39H